MKHGRVLICLNTNFWLFEFSGWSKIFKSVGINNWHWSARVSQEFDESVVDVYAGLLDSSIRYRRKGSHCLNGLIRVRVVRELIFVCGLTGRLCCSGLFFYMLYRMMIWQDSLLDLHHGANEYCGGNSEETCCALYIYLDSPGGEKWRGYRVFLSAWFLWSCRGLLATACTVTLDDSFMAVVARSTSSRIRACFRSGGGSRSCIRATLLRRDEVVANIWFLISRSVLAKLQLSMKPKSNEKLSYSLSLKLLCHSELESFKCCVLSWINLRVKLVYGILICSHDWGCC